uniref:Uncharacterized protein n=1 Tax=Panagrellus redivivus TaxID=6233 RepID=A0A7E4ZT97_PANRE
MILLPLFGAVLMILTTFCFVGCSGKKNKSSQRNTGTKNTSEKHAFSMMAPRSNPPISDSGTKPTRPSCERTMPNSQSPNLIRTRASSSGEKKQPFKRRSRVSSEASSKGFTGNNVNDKPRSIKTQVALGSSTQPNPIVPDKSNKSLRADRTQSESLKVSPAPIACSTHKTEESEEECEIVPIDLKQLDEQKVPLPKTPAHMRHTLVVPEEKVQQLGELDKVLQARKAALTKEIEDMSSTHEFDKPGCPLSAENAGPINSKRHVVIAESKCQRYTIAGDEVEEAPTQSEVFDFTPNLF